MKTQAARGYQTATILVLQAAAPWFQRQSRRIVLLIWWTLTLQLPAQLGFWLRARRIRRFAPITPGREFVLLRSVNPAQLCIPRAPMPIVSVIIPTHGKVDYTLACLASIAAHPPQAAMEVVVIDDATPDGSTTCLAEIDGIRLLVNPRNLGYLRSCNAAARIADGEFLLFLNNDTQVLSGWLDALLVPFRMNSNVGAVGSMLLYPDGRLQEAGGIVWADGSGWNYGRLDDPDRPVYNYLREVDYCSGASLMVPSALFGRLGGFDEAYAPAYCEDSDLAFRLREQGYRVLYQPRSRVVHYEGVSHGRQLAGGIKAFQVRNQQIFHAHWQGILSREHQQNGQHVMRARDRALQRKIALIVDHYVPEPDRDAGSRTMLCCIRALQQAGMVVKFWPHNLYYNPGYTDALQDIGVEVAYGGDADSFEHWLTENGDDVDYALLSRPQVAAAVLPALKRHPSIRLFYYGHDLHFRRMRLQAQVLKDAGIARQADQMEQLERSVWRDVDLVLYPSDEETAAVIAMEPGVSARTLLPYCFPDFVTPRQPAPEPVILFVGSFAHLPNQEAVLWLVNHVLPLVRARVTGARLTIVGSNPSPVMLALACDSIRISANVSDAVLREIYRTARVAAVPLRYGAGVKLKVIEAMREGLPLVTTSTGAQGLPDLADVSSICDDTQQFADAICRLLTDDALWVERSAAQIGYVSARYSEAAFRDRMKDAMDQSPRRCAVRWAS
jgi:GT2 family glycosyltransferase